jgi:hypothetical protein
VNPFRLNALMSSRTVRCLVAKFAAISRGKDVADAVVVDLAADFIAAAVDAAEDGSPAT